MAAGRYIRLRQICLAAPDLAEAEHQLRAVFGLDVSHRDDRVFKYGLENIVMPVNSGFLEVVAPTRDGTAVGRYLERFDGKGGYMAMFDCSDFAHWRQLVETNGVRIAKYQKYPRYEHMQLHPKDTGATMFEIHHNTGGDDLFAHYDPGGEDWQAHIRKEKVVDLLGVDIVTPRPDERTAAWSRIFDRPAAVQPDGSSLIAFDHGFLRILPARAGEEELLTTVHLSAGDPDAVLARGKAEGLPVKDRAVEICGVWFTIHPIDEGAIAS